LVVHRLEDFGRLKPEDFGRLGVRFQKIRSKISDDLKALYLFVVERKVCFEITLA